jgi:hypothetical protein
MLAVCFQPSGGNRCTGTEILVKFGSADELFKLRTESDVLESALGGDLEGSAAEKASRGPYLESKNRFQAKNANTVTCRANTGVPRKQPGHVRQPNRGCANSSRRLARRLGSRRRNYYFIIDCDSPWVPQLAWP